MELQLHNQLGPVVPLEDLSEWMVDGFGDGTGFDEIVELCVDVGGASDPLQC